jgi:hypothetical protein
MADPDIGKLALELGSPDPRVRLEASERLEDVTRWEGEGVSAAIEALAKALSDKEEKVRKNAAWSLQHAVFSFGHPDWSVAIPAMAEALSSKDEGVPTSVAWTLRLISQGKDISAAVPALAKVIFDGKHRVTMEHAAKALISAARRGADAASVIPALKSSVRRKIISRRDAEGILESEAALQKKRDAVLSALAERFPELASPRWALLGNLKDAAGRGEDISAAMPMLACLLCDEEQHFRDSAAGVFEAAAANEKSRDAALSAFAGALYDVDSSVRCFAVQMLGSIGSKKVDISAAMPALLKTLFDDNREVRLYSAETLGLAGREGTDISAAVLPLVKSLFDPVEDVATNANWALSASFNSEKNRVAASFVLAGALSHEDIEIRRGSAVALEIAIENCTTAEQVNAIETRLAEERGAIIGKCQPGKQDEPIAIMSMFSRLMGETAKRREALASQRDVLLDDKPEPPKAGTMFREIRRALRNG